MVTYSRHFGSIRNPILGAVAFLILIGFLLQGVTGSTYYSIVMQNYATVSSPPVILQSGTAGTSTIYANSTSAKVSVVAPAPAPTYYPNEYNNLTGTHLSGTVPTSVETVDADYFIVRSSGSATSTLTYNPSDYDLLGGTTLVSGTTGDLVSDNAVYMNFSSYDSGTDTLDFVDNNISNVDYSANKGTHSNFTAQQYGPDSINDTLKEEYTGGNKVLWLYVNSFDGEWNAWEMVGTDPYVDAIDYNSSYVYVNGNLRTIGGFNFTDSGKTTETINNVTVQLYARQSEAGQNLEVKVWVGSQYYTLDDQVTPTSWGWMNWTATTYLDTLTKIDEAKIQIKAKSAKGTYYVDCARLQVDYIAPDNHELDLEVQWTNVDFTETNEELCIFGGTMDAENITVDIWNGTAWQNLFTDLDSGWNNKTVFSYLTSSNFTIRFKGGNETGDTTQDSWNIDVVLLHVWTDQYTSEVEFIGASNTYSLTQLNWTVDLQWTIANVSVTLQLYNFTLGNYPTSGYGYMSYTSGEANTDQNITQSIDVNPTQFRNSTGYWKIKVTGVKNTTAQFGFKADWIESKPSYYSEYTVSTEFVLSAMTKNTPTQLNFTVVTQYNISNVNVTIQVWNYSSSSYVTSGEGYANYTSSGSNETTKLSINTNPQLYTSSGNAKIRVTGVLTKTSTYQQETNQVKLVYKYDASSTYDYVLAVTEQEGANWTINLLVYDNASIARLSNTTISFYDGNTSDQIIINGGTITQSEGPPYNLTSSSTIYIKMSNVNATSSGTSYIYVYLKILVPATTTYLLYRIEFEIT